MVAPIDWADPHPFVPSSAVKRALRLGSAFGLPVNPSLRIVAGEEPQTFQIVTEDPILSLYRHLVNTYNEVLITQAGFRHPGNVLKVSDSL